MNLRLLLIAARILDPRLWRRRLRQLGMAFAAIGWVWFRAVNRAEVVRAVASERHARRSEQIRSRTRSLEAERLRRY